MHFGRSVATEDELSCAIKDEVFEGFHRLQKRVQLKQDCSGEMGYRAAADESGTLGPWFQGRAEGGCGSTGSGAGRANVQALI